ncbi:ATP-binding protein [Marinicella sediminis]|uniref:histidine kinase n=1 Tax=Marinicella sediminis TaxID=1792834 RepID=A0ABV7J965_9GAMM|nr:ATP-binding protein [Marinicella sediminis]
MKLKWQISIIAFLSLSFPLVVWLAFVALNQTFQSNMLAAADKQARVIVNSVEQFHRDRPTDLQGWVAEPLTAPVVIDGSSNEWEALPWYRINHRMRFKTGQHQQQLHVLIEVLDNSRYIDLNNPSDRLIIALGDDRGIQKHTLNRQAEGPVFNQLAGAEFTAWWHEVAVGYQVEMRFSGPPADRLGLAAVNHATADSSVSFGHLVNEQIQLTPLFQQQPVWQSFLGQITPEDGQLTLTDAQGRIFYQTTNTVASPPASSWLTEVIYELAFDTDMDDGSHFFGQRVFTSFSGGTIELTVRHNEAQMALINTFIRSITWIFLIALILLLGYFVYALILAWRIRRLNKTLQFVLDDKGRIHQSLPSAKARDEIGDLSRGMSAMLAQLDEYTAYLKQLGSRLSHEMKTPISIVHTSLELLQMEQPDNEYVNRALGANHRLKFILNQLSVMSKMKQTIADSEVERFDLNGLIQELAAGYQLNTKHLEAQLADQPVMMQGSAELIAQLVDKLVQNAIDFTPPDGFIKLAVRIREDQQTFRLSVTNSGATIAAERLPVLFDSLTSFRDQKTDQPHLGLGLFLVKLIADFHQADISVHNTSDPDGVCFILSGPLIV